jgi:hypothetical protein
MPYVVVPSRVALSPTSTTGECGALFCDDASCRYGRVATSALVESAPVCGPGLALFSVCDATVWTLDCPSSTVQSTFVCAAPGPRSFEDHPLCDGDAPAPLDGRQRDAALAFLLLGALVLAWAVFAAARRCRAERIEYSKVVPMEMPAV